MPWKMGSKRMTEDPTTTAAGGQQHGPETDEAGLDHRLLQRGALGQLEFNEVHQDNRVPHHDAGPGDKTDHGGGREKGPHQGMAGQDPDKGQRDGGHDDQGRRERI